MPLFQRIHDKSRIVFDLSEVPDDERAEFKEIIKQNGGAVGRSNDSIIFIPRTRYKPEMHHKLHVYDHQYILTCVNEGRLVNLDDFRLGPKKPSDRCVQSVFLTGECLYKLKTEVKPSRVQNTNENCLSADSESQCVVANVYRVRERCNGDAGDGKAVVEEDPVSSSSTSVWETPPENLPNPLSLLRAEPASPSLKSPAGMRITRTRSYDEVRISKKNRLSVSLPHATRRGREVEREETVVATPVFVSVDSANISSSSQMNATTSRRWEMKKDAEKTQDPLSTTLKDEDVTAELSATLENDREPEISRIAAERISGSSSPRESQEVVESSQPSRKQVPARKPSTPERPGGGAASLATKKKSRLLHPALITNSPNNLCEITAADVSPIVTESSTTLLRRLPARKPSTPERRPGAAAASLATKKKSRLLHPALITNSPNNLCEITAADVSPIVTESSTLLRRLTARKPSTPERVEGAAAASLDVGGRVPEVREARKERRARTESPTNLENRGEPDPDVIADSDSADERLSDVSSIEFSETDDSGDNFADADLSPNARRRKSNAPREKYRQMVDYHKHWRMDLKKDMKPSASGLKKLPYSETERKTMIQFLCAERDIEMLRPKGLKIWSKMIKNGILSHRSPKSLQNHFVTVLLPNIEKYFGDMSNEHQEYFLKML